MDTTPRAPKIVRMRDLPGIVGLGASTIYASIASGKFPKPTKLLSGGRATGWPLAIIEEFLANPEAWAAANAGQGEGAAK